MSAAVPRSLTVLLLKLRESLYIPEFKCIQLSLQVCIAEPMHGTKNKKCFGRVSFTSHEGQERNITMTCSHSFASTQQIFINQNIVLSCILKHFLFNLAIFIFQCFFFLYFIIHLRMHTISAPLFQDNSHSLIVSCLMSISVMDDLLHSTEFC